MASYVYGYRESCVSEREGRIDGDSHNSLASYAYGYRELCEGGKKLGVVKETRYQDILE